MLAFQTEDIWPRVETPERGQYLGSWMAGSWFTTLCMSKQPVVCLRNPKLVIYNYFLRNSMHISSLYSTQSFTLRDYRFFFQRYTDMTDEIQNEMLSVGGRTTLRAHRFRSRQWLIASTTVHCREVVSLIACELVSFIWYHIPYP